MWNDREREIVELLRIIKLQNRLVLRALFQLGFNLKQLEDQMAYDYSKLEAELARNTEVDESASLLLTRLTEQIKKLADEIAGMDPAAAQAKINEFADNLASRNDALSAAVAANTPSAPPA